MQLAREEMGLETVVRTVDRSELYACDEVFLCGTGAQLSPVVDIDHRRSARARWARSRAQLAKLYFDAVRGKLPAYSDWLTPIY